MCGTIDNLRHDVRRHVKLPNGKSASFNELDKKFEHVQRGQRGQLSRSVLAALPKHQRLEFDNWVRETTKARPIPQPHLELVTFLAIGHYADENGTTIEETVGMIVSRRSGDGIILQARA